MNKFVIVQIWFSCVMFSSILKWWCYQHLFVLAYAIYPIVLGKVMQCFSCVNNSWNSLITILLKFILTCYKPSRAVQFIFKVKCCEIWIKIITIKITNFLYPMHICRMPWIKYLFGKVNIKICRDGNHWASQLRHSKKWIILNQLTSNFETFWKSMSSSETLTSNHFLYPQREQFPLIKLKALKLWDTAKKTPKSLLFLLLPKIL